MTDYPRSVGSPCDLSATYGVVGEEDMNLSYVLVYMDSMIALGRTLVEHKGYLEKVLKRLHEEELKLSLEICHLSWTHHLC